MECGSSVGAVELGGNVSDVLGFHGNYRYLSNFYIEPDKTHVEGEYQRAKCIAYHDQKQFDGLSPKRARALGRMVEMRYDWEDVKLQIMLFYVQKKFKDHPKLAAALKETTGKLVEVNTWGDQYWGECKGWGLNMLGEILMQIRAEL